MPFVKVAIWVIVLFFLTSCSPDSDSKEARQSLYKPIHAAPVFLGGEEAAPLLDIKNEVQSINELSDAAVVQNEKTILVAYKVKHMKRFQMKKIEASLKEQLKDKYPDFEFLVSSDTKIFLEVVELIVHVEQENYPKHKAQDWFAKIVHLQKAMT